MSLQGRQRQFVTFECSPFVRKVIAAVGGQARKSAVASSCEVNGVGEGQVPRLDRSFALKSAAPIDRLRAVANQISKMAS